MNRSTRTLIVVGIAVIMAAAATTLVYWTITTRPPQVVEIAQAHAVVAARPLTLGALVTAADVKAVPWPAANPVPGSFTRVEDVLDRGVIAPVAENEPLTNNNVAPKEAGAGLPPTIPPGMRAISVRVNEVIGVAGFVIPGTRVDVMVVLRDSSTGPMARVVVSNVQVLAAGTRYDQELAREGQAIPSTVVTLMVNPDDAERVGLAAIEGQLLLTLRNPLDTEPTASTGTRMTSLTTGGGPAVPAPTTPRPRRAQPPPPPPPPAPEPPKDRVVTVIRGADAKKEIIKK